MTYYEIDFSRFYFPFQRTDNGWAFAFLRKVTEDPYNLSDDEDFLKELNEEQE